MSYKVYAGVQTGVDVWETKACIYDPADYTDTKKLISPTLTREVGKAGSLELTLPLGNVAHSALQKMRTTVSVEQDGARIWEGRPMSHEQDFMLRQKVFCEGELAYLNDSSVAPYTAKDVTIKQFLSFLLENHTGMVDAYKAFTCGNVGFPSTSVVVPELHNCVMKLDHMAGTPDSDGDYMYEYGLYTSSGVQLVSQYEVGFSDDDTAPDPSAYRWTLNVKHEVSSIDGYIWRTGEGLFSVSVNVALSLDGDGQTHEATQRTVTPDITCATHSKSFPPETEYDLKDTVSKKWKIEKQGDGYAVLFNGAALPDSSVVRYDSAPRYTFGDGQNFGVTWDVIQNELVEVYGGYLIVRHENGARYLDYVREVQEKNGQPIAFGTNLLDLNSYVKAEDIVTRVIAVGKKKSGWFLWRHESTITATANDTAAQKLFGIITRIIVIDGTASTTQSLLDAANAELSKNLRYLDGITVKAVDLKDAGVDIARLGFGKMTHIYSNPHGVNTWLLCSKIVEPLDAPDKKEFTLGIDFSSVSDLQALSARKASDAYDLSRSLKGYASAKG
jgi:hypothetical protein